MRQSGTMEFGAFIRHLLQIANIRGQYLHKFTDDESLECFRKAFTHKTADETNNYEILEFIGDGILKAILSIYIPERFKELSAYEGKLSKVRRFLEQEKTLSKFALQLGFWEHVKGDELTMTQKRNKTLEDVYEAFIGALVTVIDKKVHRGVGFTYAYNFVVYSLDQIHIDVSQQKLDDPVTILNELYTRNEISRGSPLKWGFPKYKSLTLYLPNATDLSAQDYPVGTMYFNTDTKTVMVKYKDTFVQYRQVCYPIRLVYPPVTREMMEEHPECFTQVRTASVYAKPEEFVKEFIQKETKKPVIMEDDMIEIGQGVTLQQKDSRKMAAQHALYLFKLMGYER